MKPQPGFDVVVHSAAITTVDGKLENGEPFRLWKGLKSITFTIHPGDFVNENSISFHADKAILHYMPLPTIAVLVDILSQLLYTYEEVEQCPECGTKTGDHRPAKDSK